MTETKSSSSKPIGGLITKGPQNLNGLFGAGYLMITRVLIIGVGFDAPEQP